MKRRKSERGGGGRTPGISTGLRWKILARDSFACQYCGARAPDAQLEIDHIHPSSQGGSDDESNLIVACRRCNAGKAGLAPPLTALGHQIWALVGALQSTDFSEGLERIKRDVTFGLVNEYLSLGYEFYALELAGHPFANWDEWSIRRARVNLGCYHHNCPEALS